MEIKEIREDSLRFIFGQDKDVRWERVIAEAGKIREVRLRIDKPILIRGAQDDCFLDDRGDFTYDRRAAHRVSGQELEDLFMRICQGSPYAFEDMLRQGFLTVPGGHRIGLSGQVVQEDSGKIRTIKHLYYVNIRIAHQIFGVAQEVLPHLYQDGEILNTLIISPPGYGKTTLLRELIRNVSDGNAYGPGRNVGVVDERSELAGSYLGCPQNDLGCRTDVLDGCTKGPGMFLLLRAMAPEVLAVDELGGDEDMCALRTAAVCGCKVIATVHGRNPADVKQRFPQLFADNLFDRFVFPREQEERNADFGRDADLVRQYGAWTVVPGQVKRKGEGTAFADQTIGAVSE